MTKKICLHLSPDHGDNILPFSYPRYHDSGKKCYVDLYCYDPATDAMRRKKYHLDHIEGKRERRKQANAMIVELAEKLRNGWNPFVDMSTYRGYTPLKDVLKLYLTHVNKMCRKKTVQSYTSRANILLDFINNIPTKVCVCHLNRKMAMDFLDYVYLDRDVSARTYNNYKGWLVSFGEWLLDRRYLDHNPATSIPKKKEEEKKRKPLTRGMLRELYKYLTKNDPYFLLAVMMEYYTLIRPSELVALRLQYFHLSEQKVFVPGRVSKNGKDDYVGLNRRIINLMLDLKLFNYPGDTLVFSKGFRPGNTLMGGDIFNKRWHKVREDLHWGPEYQFYSLKDSGIRDLANSAGIVIARDQARHSDISTTNKYLGPEGFVREETKDFEGGLSL